MGMVIEGNHIRPQLRIPYLRCLTVAKGCVSCGSVSRIGDKSWLLWEVMSDRGASVLFAGGGGFVLVLCTWGGGSGDGGSDDGVCGNIGKSYMSSTSSSSLSYSGKRMRLLCVS